VNKPERAVVLQEWIPSTVEDDPVRHVRHLQDVPLRIPGGSNVLDHLRGEAPMANALYHILANAEMNDRVIGYKNAR
jgi:hypothetical protein